MIFTLVKCEMCENHFRRQHWERDMPVRWLTVVQGNPQEHEAQHFCSDNCLRQWLTQRATKDWEQLSAEQKDALSKERRDTADYLQALAALFEKEHPELKLTWSLKIDATLKEVKP